MPYSKMSREEVYRFMADDPRNIEKRNWMHLRVFYMILTRILKKERFTHDNFFLETFLKHHPELEATKTKLPNGEEVSNLEIMGKVYMKTDEEVARLGIHCDEMNAIVEKVIEKNYKSEKLLIDTKSIEAICNCFQKYNPDATNQFVEMIHILREIFQLGNEYNLEHLDIYDVLENEFSPDMTKIKGYRTIIKNEVKKKERILFRKRKRIKAIFIQLKQDCEIEDHPIGNKLITDKIISEDELDSFEKFLLGLSSEVEQKKQAEMIERKDAQRKVECENILELAKKIQNFKDPLLSILQEDEHISEQDLESLRLRIQLQYNQELEKRNILEELPALMKEAENLFESLYPTERNTLEKKIGDYRKAFKQMKNPKKLGKNLKWIIKKMSKRI